MSTATLVRPKLQTTQGLTTSELAKKVFTTLKRKQFAKQSTALNLRQNLVKTKTFLRKHQATATEVSSTLVLQKSRLEKKRKCLDHVLEKVDNLLVLGGQLREIEDNSVQRLKGLQILLERNKPSSTALNDLVAKADGDLHVLKGSLQRHEQEVQQARKQQSLDEMELAKIEAELQAEVTTTENRSTELQSELDQACKEETERISQSETAGRTVASLESKHAKLLEKIEGLTSRLATGEGNRLSKILESLLYFKNELPRHSERLCSWTKMENEKKTSLETKATLYNKSRDRWTELDESNKIAEQRYHDTELQIQANKQGIQQDTQLLARIEKDRKSQNKRSIKEARATLEEKIRLANKDQQEIEAQRSQLLAESRSIGDHVSRNPVDLATLITEAEGVAQKQIEFKATLEGLREKGATLRRQLSELKVEVQQQSVDLTQISAAVSELRKAADDENNELELLRTSKGSLSTQLNAFPSGVELAALNTKQLAEKGDAHCRSVDQAKCTLQARLQEDTYSDTEECKEFTKHADLERERQAKEIQFLEETISALLQAREDRERQEREFEESQKQKELELAQKAAELERARKQKEAKAKELEAARERARKEKEAELERARKEKEVKAKEAEAARERAQKEKEAALERARKEKEAKAKEAEAARERAQREKEEAQAKEAEAARERAQNEKEEAKVREDLERIQKNKRVVEEQEAAAAPKRTPKCTPKRTPKKGKSAVEAHQAAPSPKLTPKKRRAQPTPKKKQSRSKKKRKFREAENESSLAFSEDEEPAEFVKAFGVSSSQYPLASAKSPLDTAAFTLRPKSQSDIGTFTPRPTRTDSELRPTRQSPRLHHVRREKRAEMMYRKPSRPDTTFTPNSAREGPSIAQAREGPSIAQAREGPSIFDSDRDDESVAAAYFSLDQRTREVERPRGEPYLKAKIPSRKESPMILKEVDSVRLSDSKKRKDRSHKAMVKNSPSMDPFAFPFGTQSQVTVTQTKVSRTTYLAPHMSHKSHAKAKHHPISIKSRRLGPSFKEQRPLSGDTEDLSSDIFNARLYAVEFLWSMNAFLGMSPAAEYVNGPRRIR
eukprot:g50287.t1